MKTAVFTAGTQVYCDNCEVPLGGEIHLYDNIPMEITLVNAGDTAAICRECYIFIHEAMVDWTTKRQKFVADQRNDRA